MSSPSTVAALTAEHPRAPSFTYTYGTAGFRENAQLLESVMLKVGIVAALHSMRVKRPTGVMITASHNLYQDNGCKLMDENGEMVSAVWEKFATLLANAPEGEPCAQVVVDFIKAEKINLTPGVVFVGRDCRKSSGPLRNLVIVGIEAMGCKAVDVGLVTTPLVHLIVREFNHEHTSHDALTNVECKKPFDGFDDWIIDESAKRYLDVLDTYPGQSPFNLHVDCANGVGALVFDSLNAKLHPFGFKKRSTSAVHFELFNTDIKSFEKLNQNVGAEHVQKQRMLPQGVDATIDTNKLFASIDGDGDRVVMFFIDEKRGFRLLDGDKIACLFGMFFQDILKGIHGVKVGVVQTAYANGASTQYLEKTLGIPVKCVETGVKHLHHQAAKMDIGIYFEANGHGTVLISEKAIEKCRKQNAAVGEKLSMLRRLVNQAVGDVISDIFLVHIALIHLGMSYQQWDAIYADFPSYQTKVAVADRSAYTTKDAERKLVTPKGMQARVDKAAAAVKNGRAFIRPSGTENVVRIYAEAGTEEDVRGLGEALKVLLQ